MRSKTSFFNRTLYLQGIRRSWPLGAVFLLINLLTVPLPLANMLRNYTNRGEDTSFTMRLFLNDINRFQDDGLVALSLVMGLLTAALCFLWVFGRRSSGFHLALPVKREGLFISRYLSGLSMILIPLLITFAGLLLVTGNYGVLDPLILFSWLGSYAAMTCFIYSLAVLCATLTGHIVAMGALFGLFNVLFAGLHSLVSSYLSRTVYGARDRIFWTDTAPFGYKLSPIVWLTSHRDIGGYLWILAAAAVLITGVSLFIFKMRRAEAAGSGLATSRMRPVILYLVTFGAALAGSQLLMQILLPWERYNSTTLLAPLFAVLSAAIGFFTVILIQHKSLGAWKRRKKGLVLSLSVVLLLSLGLEFDWFDIERWMPTDGDVVSVSVKVNSMQEDDVMLAQPDSIALVTALHREIVENLDGTHFMAGEWPPSGMWPAGMRNYSVRMIYTLRDGSVRSCTYSAIVNILEGGSLARRFSDLCGSGEFTEKYFYRPEFAPENILDVTYNQWAAESERAQTDEHGNALPYEHWETVQISAPANQQAVYTALYEDIAAGHLPALGDVTRLPQRNERGHIISIAFEYTGEIPEYRFYNSPRRDYNITPDCVSTLAVLKRLGIEPVWLAG